MKSIDKKDESYEFILDFFKNELNQISATGKCFLFVLDNLESIRNNNEWLEQFLLAFLHPPNVYILITCRDSKFLSDLRAFDMRAIKLEVNYFTREQAEGFYTKTSKRDFKAEEKHLLEEYFKESQVLPYDLNS